MSKKKIKRQRKLRRKERGLKPRIPKYVIEAKEAYKKLHEKKEITIEDLDKKISECIRRKNKISTINNF